MDCGEEYRSIEVNGITGAFVTPSFYNLTKIETNELLRSVGDGLILSNRKSDSISLDAGG